MKLVDYVNPLMGSDSCPEFSHGNTYPVISAPSGMTAWTPMTAADMRDGWIYQYKKNQITGIKATHSPSPWINDYGDFAVMPSLRCDKFMPDQRGISFSHINETVHPYFYSVKLDDGIRISVTPTERCSFVQIYYPELVKNSGYLIIDTVVMGDIARTRKNTLTGIARDNHGGIADNFGMRFIIESSVSFKILKKTDFIAVIEFDDLPRKQVELKIGTSFISTEQAEINLKREIGESSPAEIKAVTETAWGEQLSKVSIEGANKDQLTTFYTCLYRTLLFPRIFYEFDQDGNPQHYSPYNGKKEGGLMVADNGFWDTYRTVYPLYTLLYQKHVASIIRGWLNSYKEGGWLPKWPSPGYRNCMIGTPIVNIVVDSLFKGILDKYSNEDLNILYEACFKDATDHSGGEGFGRKYLGLYERLGYIPMGNNRIETTSRTQEYAYNDYSLAMFAEYLGKIDDYYRFIKRAENYKNVFDCKDYFFKGRLENSDFDNEFSQYDWGGPFNGGGPFTEGSAWQHLFYVPHDISGLIKLFGGANNFERKLDELFNPENSEYRSKYYRKIIHEMKEMTACGMGQYSHNNQPVHNYIYLYNYIGKPWKSQKLIKYVVDNLYRPGADGFCGDEDNGELGAWYIFSSIGFYPVCPGTSEPYYVFGFPGFSKVVLNISENVVFIIETENNSDKNAYIQSAKLNGREYRKNWISHKDIIEGGVLKFVMGEEPNETWGSGKNDIALNNSKLRL